MKRIALIVCSFTVLTFSSLGQFPGQPVFPEGTGPTASGADPAAAEDLPKFDLDFPGGPVALFVDIVQDALTKVDVKDFLNVVIPTEFQNEVIPPLKLRSVNVVQLFKALEMASQRSTMDDNRAAVPQMFPMGQPARNLSYGFQTVGPVTRESIWYFYVEKPQGKRESKALRYFQLGPYLSQFTMDDIGKAISAGWNMLDENDQTQLNFHKDTKLLIAVGPPHHLEMIGMVLKELGAGMTNAAPAGTFQQRIFQEEQRAREDAKKNQNPPKL